MWKVCAGSVLVGGDIGRMNLPGEKGRMEITWWMDVARGGGPS